MGRAGHDIGQMRVATARRWRPCAFVVLVAAGFALSSLATPSLVSALAPLPPVASLANLPVDAALAMTPSPPPTSIGTCHSGQLPGGVALPDGGPGWRLLSVVRERDTRWGSPRLIAFVERVAARLHARPENADAPLRLGNLSLRGGGTMRWSHSHRAGRDVDFPLPVLDAKGLPLTADGFVQFDDQGSGRWKRRPVRFDAARTWQLVAALLGDAEVDVARLYLAAGLRDAVLQAAVDAGADPVLIDRARAMIEEPSHAGRHDDHLHVRIFCDAAEIQTGCVDEDRRWPWGHEVQTTLRAHLDAAALRLQARNVGERLAAIRTLGDWSALDGGACDALAWAASWDTAANVRAAATSALAAQHAPCACALLLGAARQQPDRKRMTTLLLAAIAAQSEGDAPRLRELLADQPEGFRVAWSAELRSRVRTLASQALAGAADAQAAPALARVLRDASAPARRAAGHALEVIANRRLPTLDAVAHWWRTQPGLAPDRWLGEGFAMLGVPVYAPGQTLAPALLGLLRAPDRVVARNAERALRQLVGGVALQHLDTPRHRHRAWQRFWQREGSKYADRRLWSAEESLGVPEQTGSDEGQADVAGRGLIAPVAGPDVGSGPAVRSVAIDGPAPGFGARLQAQDDD